MTNNTVLIYSPMTKHFTQHHVFTDADMTELLTAYHLSLTDFDPPTIDQIPDDDDITYYNPSLQFLLDHYINDAPV